jgi:short-subunit dehydrogenase
MKDANANRTAKVVWITGASQGIGRALALEMASRGWQVAASARNQNLLQTLEQEAIPLSGSIKGFVLDVCDAMACAKTQAEIEQHWGPIQRLVLNAGTHIPTPIDDLQLKDFEQLWQINVLGTLKPLLAALPTMRQHRQGKIAIVASLSGYRGLPTAAGYGASKAALINLAESLHLDLHPSGIQVQLINPGFVKTPLTDRNPFPMPFLISAEEAAKAIANGLDSTKFEIRFPTRFGLIMGFLKLLPYAPYFWLVKRFTGI